MKTEINPKEITVVVQGAVDKKHTPVCLKSIRTKLPGSIIILSTWKGANVENLDHDILIESEDPGSNMMGDYKSNCFRQIVSSINGLRAVKTKYALKIRSDLEIKNNNFLKYFIDYNQVSFDKNYKILNQRIITLTTCNPNRRYKLPFTASDWFFFGLTEDIKNVFDIPLDTKFITKKDSSGNKITLENPYYPEQYIWIQFLLKYKKIFFEYSEDISHDNISLSEKYFANNCIMLNAGQIKINWLKHPGAAYAQIPCLSNSGLYTFNEYRKLLNKYSFSNLVIISNPLEDLIYFIVYNLRFIVKKTYLKFKEFIIK